MNINDIVMVVGTKSLPKHWIGRYGKIVDVAEDKVMVEFAASSKSMGKIWHTALRNDLKVIGKAGYATFRVK